MNTYIAWGSPRDRTAATLVQAAFCCDAIGGRAFLDPAAERPPLWLQYPERLKHADFVLVLAGEGIEWCRHEIAAAHTWEKPMVLLLAGTPPLELLRIVMHPARHVIADPREPALAVADIQRCLEAAGFTPGQRRKLLGLCLLGLAHLTLSGGGDDSPPPHPSGDPGRVLDSGVSSESRAGGGYSPTGAESRVRPVFYLYRLQGAPCYHHDAGGLHVLRSRLRIVPPLTRPLEASVCDGFWSYTARFPSREAALDHAYAWNGTWGPLALYAGSASGGGIWEMTVLA